MIEGIDLSQTNWQTLSRRLPFPPFALRLIPGSNNRAIPPSCLPSGHLLLSLPSFFRPFDLSRESALDRFVACLFSLSTGRVPFFSVQGIPPPASWLDSLTSLFHLTSGYLASPIHRQGFLPWIVEFFNFTLWTS